MATPADKRSHPRVKCSVNVQVMDASGGSTMLLTDDWSMTGVFLRTRTPATLGSVVGLTFVLRPYGRQQVQGIVVRSESGSGSGARAGQGVQFIGPPPEGLACFLRDSTRVAPSLRRPECKAA